MATRNNQSTKMQSVKGNDFPQLKPLGFKLKKIQPDGNCQFRALSDQLFGTQEKADMIRAKVVNYMCNHKVEFMDFLAVNSGGGLRQNPSRQGRKTSQAGPTRADRETAWLEYLRGMRKTCTFGDNVTLQACAYVYGIDITVYDEKNHITIVKFNEKGRKALRMLHIAYHSTYDHYSSVRKVDGSRPNSTRITNSSKSLPGESLNVPDVREDMWPQHQSNDESETIVVKAPESKQKPNPRAGLEFLGEEDEDSDIEAPQPPKKTISQKPKETTTTTIYQDFRLNSTTSNSGDRITAKPSNSTKTVISKPVPTVAPRRKDNYEPPSLLSAKSKSSKETITNTTMMSASAKTSPPSPLRFRKSPSPPKIMPPAISYATAPPLEENDVGFTALMANRDSVLADIIAKCTGRRLEVGKQEKKRKMEHRDEEEDEEPIRRSGFFKRRHV